MNGPNGGPIRCIAVSESNLFAGTDIGGVYLSTNNGTNWIARNNGLTSFRINAFAVLGTSFYAGTENGGVFLSTNNGTSWTAVGLSTQIINALAISGTNLFAGTYNGVFLSSNNGTSWTTVNNGLTTQYISSLAVLGTNLFAGTYSFVFLSTNNGTSWTHKNNGLTYPYVDALVVSGTNLFAGTGGGVFLTTNNGTSWTAKNNGLTYPSVNTFTVSGTNLFAGFSNGGVFLSTNNGANWLNKNQGFISIPSVFSLIITNDYIFAGTYDQSVWRRSYTEIITGTKQIFEIVPSSYSLKQNYPNPFNPTTKITFTISNGIASLNKEHFPVGTLGKNKVVLKVYDVTAREVQTLVNETLQPGTYESSFDGSSLNSGVYFYKIIAGDFAETKKMLMIK